MESGGCLKTIVVGVAITVIAAVLLGQITVEEVFSDGGKAIAALAMIGLTMVVTLSDS